MAKARQVDAQEARSQFPQLLEDAVHGRCTVITRGGLPVAALVPFDDYGSRKQKSLLDLSGSGRGLWARSSKTLAELRDEWNR